MTFATALGVWVRVPVPVMGFPLESTDEVSVAVMVEVPARLLLVSVALTCPFGSVGAIDCAIVWPLSLLNVTKSPGTGWPLPSVTWALSVTLWPPTGPEAGETVTVVPVPAARAGPAHATMSTHKSAVARTPIRMRVPL